MVKETIKITRRNSDGSVTEYYQERWMKEETARNKRLEREAELEVERIREAREMHKYYEALNPTRFSDILDAYNEYLSSIEF